MFKKIAIQVNAVPGGIFDSRSAPVSR